MKKIIVTDLRIYNEIWYIVGDQSFSVSLHFNGVKICIYRNPNFFCT